MRASRWWLEGVWVPSGGGFVFCLVPEGGGFIPISFVLLSRKMVLKLFLQIPFLSNCTLFQAPLTYQKL